MKTSMFSMLVAKELKKARSKHGPIHSAHEGLSVIMEEFDEFKAEVWKKEHEPEKMLKELVQLAAMARRCAEDIKLVEKS